MLNPIKKNSNAANQASEENPMDNGMNCQDEVKGKAEDSLLDPEKAHIYNLIIVDESGSMSGLEKVTIDGINETINAIKKAQEDYGEKQQHFLTLVTFDESPGVPPIRTHLNAVPIDGVHGFKTIGHEVARPCSTRWVSR